MINKAPVARLAEHALALVCSQAVKTVGLLPLTKENCDLESMSRRWREAQVRSKAKSVRKLREQPLSHFRVGRGLGSKRQKPDTPAQTLS